MGSPQVAPLLKGRLESLRKCIFVAVKLGMVGILPFHADLQDVRVRSANQGNIHIIVYLSKALFGSHTIHIP